MTELNRKQEEWLESKEQHRHECYQEFLAEPNEQGIKAKKRCDKCFDGAKIYKYMDKNGNILPCPACNGSCFISRTLTIGEVLELAPKMVKDIDNLKPSRIVLTLPDGWEVYVEESNKQFSICNRCGQKYDPNGIGYCACKGA